MRPAYPPVSQYDPQVGSQLVDALGTHEPSPSQSPAHVKLAQSGQQIGSIAPLAQQREPAGHSPLEPGLAQAPVARIMQTPPTQTAALNGSPMQLLSHVQAEPGGPIRPDASGPTSLPESVRVPPSSMMTIPESRGGGPPSVRGSARESQAVRARIEKSKKSRTGYLVGGGPS